MPLSWNEIKSRAIAFSKEWEHTEREEADAKEFLIEFLNVFGITRRRVATFEHKVKKLTEGAGYIDLLWPGMLLVEMKSKGKDLDKAYTQAKEYCHGLQEHELPRLIVICDFHTFHVYNEDGEKTAFVLADLLKNIQAFALLAGYQKRTYKEQDPVNMQAAERMGRLHDKLKAAGYQGHALELYLVRLVFCLFADDTGIFDKSIFNDLVDLKTKEDGSDLAAQIAQLFQVLNTPEDKRLKLLDESVAAFPYVNGKLFEENLPLAAFDSTMRKTLLDCCSLDWGKISPAIFGSLFQSVMDEKARRNLGAHYTSEKNILKLIKPLFLDELYKEFESVKNDKKKLQKLHEKISRLRFLDPACGCGNFLIIAYRELRTLELEIVKRILKGQQVTSINDYFLMDVDQFYGVEYEEFPSQIAQVALWLMDHQMNEQASVQFGDYFKRIPLKKSATIVCGNALQMDWSKIKSLHETDIYADETNIYELQEPGVEYKTVNVFSKKVNVVANVTETDINIRYGKQYFDFILGNPPFIGKQMQNVAQKADMEKLFAGVNGAGVLDYVCAWYLKAAQLIQNTNTKVSFVSTNSISQGEQVGVLWNLLFNYYNIKIHFAHRTFKWGNEARANAAVHVVIIGFANFNTTDKFIYEYESITAEPHEIKVKNINPYLVDAPDIIIQSRSKPISNIPKIQFGNMPNDGGQFLFSTTEKDSFVSKEPNSKKYFKKFFGGYEFINNVERWCLWLKDANPGEVSKMPLLLERINSVKKIREKSSASQTRKAAETPSIFYQIVHTGEPFLIIPLNTSEKRKYLPLGFSNGDEIASNLCSIIIGANLFHFGVLSSIFHMAWMRQIAGRLKSDYRYSNSLVYNNYPWPENPTDKQKEAVEKAAQAVLDARAQFPESSLADLYDPNTMPPVLVKAHQALDKAVDLCYRPQPFTSEAKRIEFLFELYDKYTAGLFVKEKKKVVSKKAKQ